MTVALGLFALFLTFVYLDPLLLVPSLGAMRPALLVLALALSATLLSGGRPPRDLRGAVFLCLLGVAVVSTAASPYGFWDGAVYALEHLAKGVVVYVVVAAMLRSWNDVNRFASLSTLFAAVVAVTTFFTTRAGIAPLGGGSLYRMRNYFGGVGDDPNEFGVLLLGLLPVVF
jgi:hypothetical protein